MRKQSRAFSTVEVWRPTLMLHDMTMPSKKSTPTTLFSRFRTPRLFLQYDADQAGCSFAPQSTLDLYTGMVYEPCWQMHMYRQVPDYHADWQSDTYDIMNGSGTNALKFTTPGGNGIFLFGLHVVGKYSHCKLKTEFAVEVYGAPIDQVASFVVAFITLLILSISLLISYLYFQATRADLIEWDDSATLVRTAATINLW